MENVHMKKHIIAPVVGKERLQQRTVIAAGGERCIEPVSYTHLDVYKRQQVYRKKMEVPIEDMKRFLDGILHIHDEGRTKMSMGALFGIVEEAEERLSEKENSVAP